MASQTRDAAMTALVALIATITDFKKVTEGPITPGTLAEHEYPACVLSEGQDAIGHLVTNTVEITVDVGVQILYQGTEGVARGLEDKIIVKIEQAAKTLLSNTVINIWVEYSGYPFNWPDQGPTKVRNRVVRFQYSMDV